MCSPSQPTQQQVASTELPEWAKPYAKDILAKGQALTDVNQNPYQTYNQPRIAGFSPLQQQAFQGIANLQTPEQYGTGTALNTAAGLGALQTAGQAGMYGGMGARAGMSYGQQATDPRAIQAYMNPYLQASLAPQLELLNRQYGQQATQQAGQATQAGAFGGSRFGIQQAQNQLNQNLATNQLVGNAYNQAYNTAQQNMQNAAQLGMQGAGLGLQGMQGQLAGLGQAGAAGVNLANIGQGQLGAQQNILQAQGTAGAQQQALAQQGLTQAYQDFLNQQNYPYKQLGFMSDMIRGLPLGQQSTSAIYQAPPTALQTAGALGLGAYGISKMAGGGSVTSEDNVRSIAKYLPPKQLPASFELAQARGDLDAEAALQKQMAENASIQRGLGSAFNSLPPETQDGIVRAAGGGILAFKDEGLVPSEESQGYTTEGSSGSGGDFTDMQLAQLAGMAGDGQSVESGNQGIYSTASNAALNTAKQIRALQYQGYTDDQINNIIKRRFALEEQLAGPSPYGEMQQYLTSAKADRAAALEQGKGLAALQAIPAILQPGGAIRGIGAAAGAIGAGFGKAAEADRAERRALAGMQFNLADAQRKERMGMTKSAIAAAAEAEKNKRDAYTAGLNKLKAQGDIEAKVAAANRPIKIGGAGSGKVAPQTEAYNTYFKYYKEIYPEKSDAAIGKMAMDKALEMKAPGLPGVQARIEGAALETAKTRRNKRLTNDVAYLAAQRKNDLVGMAKRSDDLLMEELAKPDTDSGDGGGGANLVYDPKTKTFK